MKPPWPRDPTTSRSAPSAARSSTGALQQQADLAEVWLEPDGFGELTETHHCAACAPHGPVTDLACAVCGDGPLLVGADQAAAASGTITEQARRWLTGHGWQIEPELTCPHHTLAQ